MMATANNRNSIAAGWTAGDDALFFGSVHIVIYAYIIRHVRIQ